MRIASPAATSEPPIQLARSGLSAVAARCLICSAVSTGYSVFKNAWISVGYNFSGFDDRDFSDANYTVQGPYLQFRFKFDDSTAKEIAGHLGL